MKARGRSESVTKTRAKTQTSSNNSEYWKRSQYITYLRNIFEITVFMFRLRVC